MNVFWLLVIACAAVLIQMAVFRAAGQKGITYVRYFSASRAQVGEKLELVEDITARRFVPVPWLRVESRIPSALAFTAQKDLNIEDEFYHRSIFTLMPFRHIRRRYQVTCTHRGLYDLTSVTLTSGDLLGLYSAHRTLSLDAKLLVYPQLKSFSALELPSRQWQGDVAVRRWIQPDPFLVNGIREYRMGDNRRDIHAGATARTGVLQVKTHDYTASPRMLIVLNAQMDEDQWGVLTFQERESLEDAVSLAATMVAWCRKERVACGFASNGQLQGAEKEEIYLGPQSAPQHYNDCMELVARIIMQRRISFHSYMERLARLLSLDPVDVVVLSCYWSEGLEAAAATLRGMGHAVYHYPIARKEAAHDRVV